mgnify:CR=1 FL=1
MNYKYTISDKGSNSSQSNSWSAALVKCQKLAKENGNPITIACNRGHFSETFELDSNNQLIPAYFV